MGSQAWADGRTKSNIAPKNVHTLLFLVVGDQEGAFHCLGVFGFKNLFVHDIFLLLFLVYGMVWVNSSSSHLSQINVIRPYLDHLELKFRRTIFSPVLFGHTE